MTISQKRLQHEVAKRIRVARPDLADHDLSTVASMLDVRAELEAELAVVCVVQRLDLVSLIRGTCAFAAALTGDQVDGWRAAFTRTVFLAGNPRNLSDRFAFRYVDPDGAAAWTDPSAPGALAPLRRLLRLFHCSGTLPMAPPSVTVPGQGTREPVRHDLYLATADVSAADGLVHLGHLLTEAVFDGLISGGDQLVVRQVPRIVGVTEPFAALRASTDPACPDRLRAYAGLSRSAA